MIKHLKTKNSPPEHSGTEAESANPLSVDETQPVASRHLARQLLMQTLYQWQITDKDLSELVNGMELNVSLADDYAKADKDYFRMVLRAIVSDTARYETAIDAFLDRPIIQMDPIERAILLVGTCELVDHSEVPYRVVINEAVELAKGYGADQSHKFINGVLDKFAAHSRAVERSATQATLSPAQQVDSQKKDHQQGKSKPSNAKISIKPKSNASAKKPNIRHKNSRAVGARRSNPTKK